MARQYRTLSELRAELRAACGFGSTGAAAGANQTLIDKLIRDAQTILYWAHDWAHLRDYDNKALGTNQYLIDYPTTCNPDRVKAISVLRGSVWSPPLLKGISPQMYTTQDNTSWPKRWEPYEQIELWPKADQSYTVRVFFIANMAQFTQDAHRASIDDTLVMLGATAFAKAHYRQPDAAIYKEQWDTMLARLKAKSWGKDVFNPDDWMNDNVLVKPQTV